MSAIVKEVYDAFKEAGVSEEKSTEAAKAIADFDGWFAKVETDLLIYCQLTKRDMLCMQ